MKFGTLVAGLLIGGLLGFGLSTYLSKSTEPTKSVDKAIDSASSTSEWVWPDSLDAVKAAPKNHNIVYEDSTVRVLQVVLDGHNREPIHTHKWKSIMWITKPAVPCVVYQYKPNENGKFVATDSVTIPHMDINVGSLNNAEGPTGIKNLGSDNGIAYRVEFKKEFKP